jgi:hypothetical protein
MEIGISISYSVFEASQVCESVITLCNVSGLVEHEKPCHVTGSRHQELTIKAVV